MWTGRTPSTYAQLSASQQSWRGLRWISSSDKYLSLTQSQAMKSLQPGVYTCLASCNSSLVAVLDPIKLKELEIAFYLTRHSSIIYAHILQAH